MDSDGERVSLAAGHVKLITKNGQPLTPDDQETLWFSVENPTGTYNFSVTTVDDKKYVAVLNWTQP